ncbi:metallophosphoesterase [Paenalkalicoccus suaedae]|uniref:Metallophosphoesterase n=1 Tax=Paenalkalicoccus suaedae TaxID=2592382 RepID=A0A859FFB2_9BACI|nr:metallophosphoesterase [Paenalkalicoccus suaedae]QKS71274.1 metallophosphoesterase [Paenalkalicoccus suaedae]
MNRTVVIGAGIFILMYIALHVYLAFVTALFIPVSFTLLAILFSLLGLSYLLANKLLLAKLIGSIWFAILTYMLMVLPILHLLYYVAPFALLQIVFATTFILYMIAGLFGAYSTKTIAYSITVPKRQATQDKLRLVLASDMHFGGLSGHTHVKRLVKHVNALKPDSILLAGDIVDDDPAHFHNKHMDETMAKLQAPFGKLAVLGNHEYYGKEIPKLRDILSTINIQLLEDASFVVADSLRVIGRLDQTDRNRQSVDDMIGDEHLPVLVMDHQPTELEKIADAGAHISVSGHTHRGQIWPFHLITERMFFLDYGYKKHKQLHAFVSSGFGFWGPPIRIGTRSEIVCIDVTFSDET